MRTIFITAAILAISLYVGAQERPLDTIPLTSTKTGSSISKVNTTQKTDAAEKASRGEPQMPPCNQTSPCYVIEVAQAKGEEQQTKEDSLDTLTRRYMWATIIGVAGAFIGLAVLIWQTVISRTAANAAKASADAAISTERAWIMIGLERVPAVGLLIYGTATEHGGPERHSISARIRCVCSNQGKTPAKILEKRAALILVDANNPLPLDPNLEIEIQDTVPHYLQSRDEAKRDWTLFVNGQEEMGTMIVIYGIVRYTHMFSNQDVYSTFGYRVAVNGEFERLTGYPKYNQNT